MVTTYPMRTDDQITLPPPIRTGVDPWMHESTPKPHGAAVGAFLLSIKCMQLPLTLFSFSSCFFPPTLPIWHPGQLLAREHLQPAAAAWFDFALLEMHGTAVLYSLTVAVWARTAAGESFSFENGVTIFMALPWHGNIFSLSQSAFSNFPQGLKRFT